jgi:hypothetical protein
MLQPPQVLASLKHIVILLLLAMSAQKKLFSLGVVQGKIEGNMFCILSKKKAGFW